MLLPRDSKKSRKEIQFVLKTTEGNKWVPGIIKKQQGLITYKVKISETLIRKRHVDQLRARVEEADYFTSTSKPAVT